MNQNANQLSCRLRLLVALVFLLMVPFVAMLPRAASMDEQSMYTQQGRTALDCTTACERAMNLPPPTTILKEDETRTPSPERQEIVSYQPFRAVPMPKKLRPTTSYGMLPGRPPDIVKLSGHLLF